jgi:hypothetical protein
MLSFSKGRQLSMMLFCPKCGAAAQSAATRTIQKEDAREEDPKMRVLEVVSAGLSLTAGEAEQPHNPLWANSANSANSSY